MRLLIIINLLVLQISLDLKKFIKKKVIRDKEL